MGSFITLLLCGIIFVVIGRYMKRKPPEKINPYQGYRTKRSKQSQEAWDFAQVYSAELLTKVGLYMAIASIPFLFISESNLTMFAMIAIILFFCLMPIIATEKELKNRFGDNP